MADPTPLDCPCPFSRPSCSLFALRARLLANRALFLSAVWRLAEVAFAALARQPRPHARGR